MVEGESDKRQEKPATAPVIPSSLESQEVLEAVTLPAVSQPFTLRNPVLPGTVGSPRAPTPRGSAHPAPLLLPQSATAPGHLSATWWPSAKLQHRPPPRRALCRCYGAWLRGREGGGWVLRSRWGFPPASATSREPSVRLNPEYLSVSFSSTCSVVSFMVLRST